MDYNTSPNYSPYCPISIRVNQKANVVNPERFASNLNPVSLSLVTYETERSGFDSSHPKFLSLQRIASNFIIDQTRMIEMLARKIRGLVNLNLPSSFIKGNEQLVVTSNSCFSLPSPFDERVARSPVRKISNRISSRNWGMQLKIESGTLPTPPSITSPRSNVGEWTVVHLLTREPCDCYLKKKKKRWSCFFLLLMFCSTRYHLFIRVSFCGCEFFFN